MIEFPLALEGWYNCLHPLRLTVPFSDLFSISQCRHTVTRCAPPLLDVVHLNVSVDALAMGFVSYWRTLLAARSRCILDNWWNLFVAFIGEHNILLTLLFQKGWIVPSSTFMSIFDPTHPDSETCFLPRCYPRDAISGCRSRATKHPKDVCSLVPNPTACA